MKIPGYKHLIEDVLPDLNNYLDIIQIKAFRKHGEIGDGIIFNGVDESGNFSFDHSGNIIKSDFKAMYSSGTTRAILKIILSWYLWAKYTEKNNTCIYTEKHPGDYIIMPGLARGLGKYDKEEFSTVWYTKKKYVDDEIGTVNIRVPHTINPLEVVSWKLLTKPLDKKRRK